MKIFTRRDFVKTSLYCGVPAAFASPGNFLIQQNISESPSSRVALMTGDNRADLAFRALSPFSKEISQAIGKRRVVLKPNNVYNNNQLACTHVDTIEGVLEFLKSINKLNNVVIAESPASGPAFDAFESYGYFKLSSKYPVKYMDIDKEPSKTIHGIIEKDLRPHDLLVSGIILDPASYVISLAKLKTHNCVVATMSLKNIVVGSAVKDEGYTMYESEIKFNKNAVRSKPGATTNKMKFHSAKLRWVNYNIYYVSRFLHPDLAVIDGLEGMEGNGPHLGTPVRHNVCVASPDWLAADRVSVELMGIDFAKIGYLNFCAEAGYGESDLSKIEIIGEPLKNHIKSYKLADNIEAQLSWMTEKS